MEKLEVQKLGYEKNENGYAYGHGREDSKFVRARGLKGRKERARGTWNGIKTVGRLPLTSHSMEDSKPPRKNDLLGSQSTPKQNLNQFAFGSSPSPPQQIRDLSDAFPSLDNTESQRELLRQRAREANARMELEQEKSLQQSMIKEFHQSQIPKSNQKKNKTQPHLQSTRVSRTLSKDFEWDFKNSLIREKSERKKSIRKAQEGASSDLERPKSGNSSGGNWRTSFVSSKRRSTNSMILKVKRKSLALSKSATVGNSNRKKGQSSKFEMVQKVGSQPTSFF